MKRIETTVTIRVRTVIDGETYTATQSMIIPSFRKDLVAEKLGPDLMRGFIRAFATVERKALVRWNQLGRRPNRPV